MDKYGFVYKVDFFKEKGDTAPYQNIIVLNAEDTHWLFATKEYAEELVKIEYARIPTDNDVYMRAKITSKAIKELNEKSPEMPISEK
jgi:hypothetical protein